MGVKDLWTILSPTCERKSLYDLQGKTIAVDLSCWVVEDQSVATYSTQPRMYLRNLFFRTTCLLMLNVKPVFVLEGQAPTLKHDTMARRNEAQQKSHQRHHGPSQSQPTQTQNNAKKGTRSRLKSLLKQCEEMLRVMGVSCVQSVGEAEALCARLNAAGMVEGCITQDGDCFLYGAAKVYRNFTISTAGGSSSSGFSVDVFDMEQVWRHLSLGRNKMVALALLLGCDYAPGVAGVGKVAALTFLDAVDDQHVLDRLHRWRTDPYFEGLEQDPRGLIYKTPEERKAIITELNIRKKALEDPGFPSREVISEFLGARPLPEALDLDWHEPSLGRFITLSVKLMCWTETYAVEKFFPLVARWQVARLAAAPSTDEAAFSPAAIAKKRVQKGVASYEVRWADNESFLSTLTLDEDKTVADLLVSVEPQSLVDRAFPRLVAAYEAELLAKKLSKKKPTRKGKENAPTQTRIDAFLKPSALPKAPTVGKPPAKKPAKRPLVTVASLMKQTAAIERRNAAKRDTRPPLPCRRVAEARAARSPLRETPVNRPPFNRPDGFPSPGASPIPGGKRGKRFASPRLKVGLKTRKTSTPGKCFSSVDAERRKMSTPGERLSMRELERSFRNVSLVDYSEDDEEFSDLSAIIDGIVGFSDEEFGFDDRESDFVSAGEEKVQRSNGNDLFGAASVESDHRTVSNVIPTHVVDVDSESEDEFDFCNLKIVPLHIKLGSQMLK